MFLAWDVSSLEVAENNHKDLCSELSKLMFSHGNYTCTRVQWALVCSSLGKQSFADTKYLLLHSWSRPGLWVLLFGSSTEVRGWCSEAEMTHESVYSAFTHHCFCLGHFYSTCKTGRLFLNKNPAYLLTGQSKLMIHDSSNHQEACGIREWEVVKSTTIWTQSL